MSGYERGSSQRSYRGVRVRKWGKWVSEIRSPQTQKRIWLGSYRSAKEAAHAYDAALICLRGNAAQLNFPNYHYGIRPRNYTQKEVQLEAAAAAAASENRPFNRNEFVPTSSSDSDDGPGQLEDISHPDPHGARPSTSAQPSYHEHWRSDMYNPDLYNEMASGMLIPPPHDPNDDSDDDDDADSNLWNYHR